MCVCVCARIRNICAQVATFFGICSHTQTHAHAQSDRHNHHASRKKHLGNNTHRINMRRGPSSHCSPHWSSTDYAVFVIYIHTHTHTCVRNERAHRGCSRSGASEARNPVIVIGFEWPRVCARGLSERGLGLVAQTARANHTETIHFNCDKTHVHTHTHILHRNAY